jgi:replicative DNA helicase
MNEQLYSLQAEKHILSGLIKYPDLFFEIDQHYTDDIFYSDVHKTIFNVIKTFIIKGSRQKNDTLDPIIIGQKVKDLGIKFKDDIDIIEYLSTFSLIQVSQKAVKHAAEELEKLKVCRDIIKTGEKIIKQVKTVGDKSVEEIVDNVDRIYSETVKLKSVKNKPQKLLINTIEIIEERAKKPLEEVGLITPHKEFNLKFGGLRPGNIYAFVARPKEGKTLYLTDLILKSTQLNPKCKGLILDTEMETKDINFRLASALSNIPSWWLETGNWIKKPEYVEAWKAAKEIIKIQRPVEHLHVAGKPVSEIKSLIRRWYYENVDVANGETAIIDYDYIKMTGESSADMKEWQIIGDKINTFKELSVELNVPILTACQLNRDGARGINTTASIAMSDRLTWFATFVGIFRKKTIEEIMIDGNDFGTHILDPLVYRFEGREAFGHMDLVRVQDQDDEQPRYIKNMFHYNVNNFNVTECGTTKDLYNRRRLQIEQGRMPEEEINF